LKEAESSFNKSKADYDRAKNLIHSKTISQADFDKIRAQLNSASAKLDTATNNLEYTNLKASFDGVIAKKYTENFQEINAKSPIVALHDLTSVYLKIEMPESIMVRVQREKVTPTLTARLDAIPDEEFPVVFKEVSTQPDNVTKTYQVTLLMENPLNHTILPGMTAVVRAEGLLHSKGGRPSYYLPVKAVLKDSQGNYVFTVNDKGDGIGIIESRKVTVGEITSLGIEIFSGVEQGDEVLTAGMSKVSNGMEVKYQAN